MKIPFSKSTFFKLFFNPVFLLEKAKERMVLARPTSNLKLHHWINFSSMPILYNNPTLDKRVAQKQFLCIYGSHVQGSALQWAVAWVHSGCGCSFHASCFISLCKDSGSCIKYSELVFALVFEPFSAAKLIAMFWNLSGVTNSWFLL